MDPVVPQMPGSAGSQSKSDSAIIDRVCDQFEQQFRRDADIRIESFLPAEPHPLRSQILRELLTVEREILLSRGTTPDADKYRLRFPEFADLVAELFQPSSGVQETCASGATSPSRPAATDLNQPPPGLDDHPRYRLIRLIGSGGMGSVYLAEHRMMQRSVALKVIRPDSLGDTETRQRFHREIRLAAKLHHANIVTAFDAEQLGEIDLLAMEYVEGIDLGRHIAQSGPISIGKACELVRQAALGLQHAHELGMAHRDIKPHNLMLTPAGQVKILDFGLAHLVRDEARATQSGTLLGSVDFMAPEQANDSRSADIRADIYALGCTLYYLLTGQAPFPSRSLLEKIQAHSTQTPPRPRDLPDSLWQVLQRMLAKDPADRFQQPSDVAAALSRHVGLAGFAAAPSSQDLDVPESRSKVQPRSKLQASLVGHRALIVAALATILVAAVAWQSRSRSLSKEAQQAYDDAIVQLDKRRERATRNAIVRLLRVIESAPHFAPAHIALAKAYNLQADYNWEMPEDVYPLARKAAERALALEPNSAEALLALAFTIDGYECNHSEAERLFKQALKLDPHSIDAKHWYAWFLLQQKQYNEAEKEIDRAAELGATNEVLLINRGTIRYYEGSYNEAIEAFQKALDRDDGLGKAHMDLGMALAMKGQWDKALAEFAKTSGLTEDGRDMDSLKAYVFALGKDREKARQILQKLESLSATKPLAYDIATIYAALGDKTTAFQWLRKAFDQRAAARSYIQVDPCIEPLRDDPGFSKFVREAGFPDSVEE